MPDFCEAEATRARLRGARRRRHPSGAAQPGDHAPILAAAYLATRAEAFIVRLPELERTL
ncbi:MAG: hypothetical protein ACLPYS_19100 [Vulcanimicrobiaceae bacterium]